MLNSLKVRNKWTQTWFDRIRIGGQFRFDSKTWIKTGPLTARKMPKKDYYTIQIEFDPRDKIMTFNSHLNSHY